MIKKILILLCFISLFSGEQLLAQNKKVASPPNNNNSKRSPASVSNNKKLQKSSNPKERNSNNEQRNVKLTGFNKQLAEALALIRQNQYQQAIPLLHVLSKRPELAAERAQIKYIMANALMELRLYQVAAFQFVDLIRMGNSKYIRQGINKLSLAADFLGDDTLLNYAISKVQLEDFPAENRDMIYFRLGEVKMKSNKFEEAQDLFSKVPANSRYYLQAKYNRGLAFAEIGKNQEAIEVFKNLLNQMAKAPITDTNKVAAQIALARVYYQAHDWENSLAMYRLIPRDHELWHDALFESSWAHMRAAKFRSALSNFQSLHSSYYEEYYIPESLLLRSIVYLYICKYDEMDKVINLFEKTYLPMKNQIANFMRGSFEPLSFFAEIEKSLTVKKDRERKSFINLKLPYSVLKKLMDQGEIRRSINYMRNLNDEKQLLSKYSGLTKNSFNIYAEKIISNRFNNSKIMVGDMMKYHLTSIQTELTDFIEQFGFVRYEMINGKKEQIKKKISGKEIPKNEIDSDSDREFYAQNGYEYWPFDGEFWIDEIGNFHYLGKQGCE